MIVTKETKLKDPVFLDPSLLAVLNRFEIYPGIGEFSIRQICEQKGVSTDLLLAIINIYLNRDYIPQEKLSFVPVDTLIKYLRDTDEYYKSVQLPNIDRHFNILLRTAKISQTTGVAPNIEMLNSFYQEVKQELLYFIEKDEVQWFTTMKWMHDSDLNTMQAGEELLEDKIRDLLSFFVVHLKGEYDWNLCVAVISAISVLGKDIEINNRIRSRVLRRLLCER